MIIRLSLNWFKFLKNVCRRWTVVYIKTQFFLVAQYTTLSMNETCIKLVTRHYLLMRFAFRNSADLIGVVNLCINKQRWKIILLTWRTLSTRSKRVATRKNITSCVHCTHNLMTSYLRINVIYSERSEAGDNVYEWSASWKICKQSSCCLSSPIIFTKISVLISYLHCILFV